MLLIQFESISREIHMRFFSLVFLTFGSKWKIHEFSNPFTNPNRKRKKLVFKRVDKG